MKRELLLKVLVGCLFCFAQIGIANAQVSTEGKDFWFGYMENGRTNTSIADMYIYISTKKETDIKVVAMGGSTRTYNNVPANTIRRIAVNSAFGNNYEVKVGGQVYTNRAFHITTDEKVSVFIFNKKIASADAAVILPTPALGKEYYVMSHHEGSSGGGSNQSEFLIVALEDSTEIEITPSVTSSAPSWTIGTTHTIELDSGEAYMVKANDDLTGSHVKVVSGSGESCSGTIAVFGGNEFGAISNCTSRSRDHLVEQMYPVSTWGKQFITVPYQERDDGDWIKVIASEDSTVLAVSGEDTLVLDAGEFEVYEDIDDVRVYSASKPICVGQFSTTQKYRPFFGSGCDQNEDTGDPFMIMCSPNEQMLTNVNFLTFDTPDVASTTNDPFEYFLTIITTTKDVGLVKLDGVVLTGFTEVPDDTTYSYYEGELDIGENYNLTSDSGYIAYIYGYQLDQYESLGYCAGVSLNNLNGSVELSQGGSGSSFESIGGDRICLGSEYSMTVSTDTSVFKSFSWDFDDGNTASGDTVTHTYDEPGDYDVSLTMSTADGDCGVEEVVVRSVSVVKPSATISPQESDADGEVDVCEDGIYTYLADSVVEVDSFIWVIEGGTILSGQGTDTVVVQWGGENSSAKVKLTPKNNGINCEGDEVVRNINVNKLLTVSTPVGVDTLCTWELLDHEYDVDSVHFDYTYLWDISGGSITSSITDSTKIEVDWGGAGTGKLWLNKSNIMDSLCYDASDTLFIHIQQAYDSTMLITANEEILCKGETFIFEASDTEGFITFNWDFDDSNLGSGDSLSHTYADKGTYEVFLTAKTANDICFTELTDSLEVSVSHPTIPSISGDDEVCSSDSLVEYVLSDTEDNTYDWEVEGGSVSSTTDSSAIVNWDGTNSGAKVKLFTTNSEGCEDSVIYDVNINAFEDTNTPTANDSICTYAMTGLTYELVGETGYSYDWQLDGGSITVDNTTDTIVVDWSGSGIGLIWLEPTNDGEYCFNRSDTLKVPIREAPDTSVSIIETPDSVCLGATFTLKQTAEEEMVFFSWYINEEDTLMGDTVDHSFSTIGLKEIIVHAETGDHVCYTEAFDTVEIFVVDPVATITGERHVCPYDEDITYQVVTETLTDTHEWSVIGGGTITNGQGTDEITVDWTDTDLNAQVKLVPKHNLGCIGDTVRFDVFVNELDTTQTPIGSDSVCTYDMLGVEYKIDPRYGYGYDWQVSGGTIATDSDSTITIDWSGTGIGSIWIDYSNVVDSLCFDFSDTVDVVKREAPDSTLSIISLGDTVCANSPLTFTQNSDDELVFFTWDMGDGTILTGGSVTHTYTTGGDYTIKLTGETGDHVCYTELQDSMTVYVSKPSATIEGPIFVCPDGAPLAHWAENEFLTDDYTWLADGGSINSGQGEDSIYVSWGSPNTDAHIYLVPKNTTFGCHGDTVDFELRINEELKPIIPSGEDSVCSDLRFDVPYSVVFNNTSVYNWKSDGGLVISGQGTNAVTVSWDGVGTGHVWYIETSELDTFCAGISDTLRVITRARPDSIITITPSRDTACIGEMITFTQSSDSEFKYFDWAFGDGDLADGPSSQHAYADSGTYQVILHSITDQHVCETDIYDTLTIYIVKPNTAIVGREDVCEYQELSLYTTENDYYAYTFEWLATGGAITAGKNADTAYVDWDGPSTSALMRVVPRSLHGCYGDTATYDVHVRQYEHVSNPLGEDSLCIEDRFGQLYQTNPENGQAYNWDITGGTMVTSPGTPDITVDWDTTVATSSTGKIWLNRSNIIDSICWDASDTLTVFLEPAPDELVTISLDDTSFCAYADVEFTLTNDPLLHFINWDFGDGSTLDSVPVGDNVTHSYDDDGTYLVKLTAFTGKLCQTLGGGEIEVNIEKPFVSITGDPYACQGKEGYIYYAYDTALLTNTYRWFAENGSITGPSRRDSVVIEWASADTGYVKILSTSPKGCKADTFTYPVVLNPILETQIPVGTTELCADEEYLAGNTYSVDETYGYAYDWHVDFGGITSGYGTKEVEVDWDGEGTGKVWLGESHVVDTLCFGTSDTLRVIIHPALDSLVEVLNVTNVQGVTNRLDVNWLVSGVKDPDASVLLYREDLNTGNIRRLGVFDKPSGVYADTAARPTVKVYNYWIETFNKCTDTLEALRHNNILLELDLDEREDEVYLTWNEYNNWENGVDRYDIYHKGDGETAYSLYDQNSLTDYTYPDGITSFEHCFYVEAHEMSGHEQVSRSNEVCISFEHKIEATEIITPNNDGFNDLFTIRSIERYPENNLLIFSRGGQEIHFTDDYQNNWNGITEDGKLLVEGAYFYIFRYRDINGQWQTAKGAFTIVR